MGHIIVGLLGIVLGLWGIALNWYQFLDLLWILVPLAVLFGGIVALLAGISNFGKNPRSEVEVKGAPVKKSERI